MENTSKTNWLNKTSSHSDDYVSSHNIFLSAMESIDGASIL